MSQSDPPSVSQAAIQSAARTLTTEINGMAELRAAMNGALGVRFAQAIDQIAALRGRLVVSGMGKSGHVARKIAATLASTGTPSLFMHPAESSHGDLGMVTTDDAVLALSWSGETREFADIIAYTRRYAIPLVAMTSRAESALGRAADTVLELPVVSEACPHGLAPTTSTLLQMALGDALAIALLERRGFTPADFRAFHPGGKLGAALLTVADLMRPREDAAVVSPDTAMGTVIVEMTRRRMGCAVVVADGRVGGIVTDGDLRRHMDERITTRAAREIMSGQPLSITPDTLASVALARMAERRVLVLVVEHEGELRGVLTIADLMAAGIALPDKTI